MKIEQKKDLLDEEAKVRAIDKQDMLGLVFKMPEMLEEALAFSEKLKFLKNKGIKKIVIGGMGGSAVAGDIVEQLLFNSPVSVRVVRGYELPADVDSGTLFFALSYSGNTEETLGLLDSAKKKKAKIIAITSGGKLSDLAKRFGYSLVIVPPGRPPRAALPYILAPMLLILEQAGILKGAEKDLLESADVLKKLREECGLSRGLRSNHIKQLAHKLKGKIPMVISSQGIASVAAYRWKTQFSENSKITSLISALPELDHNEIVNLAALKRTEHNFVCVALRDDKDNERIKKRFEITKSLVSTSLGGVTEIFSNGRSALARMLSLIYVGDFLSVYLAVLCGVDPTPVDVIEKLKKELSR